MSEDALWSHIRTEAQEALKLDPALSVLLLDGILHRGSFEEAVIYRVSNRLEASALNAAAIADAFLQPLLIIRTLASSFALTSQHT